MNAHRSNLAMTGLLLACAGLFCFAAAQNGDSLLTQTEELNDSVSIGDTTASTLHDSAKTTSTAVADSAPPPRAATHPDTGATPEGIKLVKRSYNGKQQVVLATGMMIFVVAIMTAAQQWNPR